MRSRSKSVAKKSMRRSMRKSHKKSQNKSRKNLKQRLMGLLKRSKKVKSKKTKRVSKKRKSSTKKQAKIAVMVKTNNNKKNQRGGGPPSSLSGDYSVANFRTAINANGKNIKKVALADPDIEWYDGDKNDILSPGSVEIDGNKYKMYILSVNDENKLKKDSNGLYRLDGTKYASGENIPNL